MSIDKTIDGITAVVEPCLIAIKSVECEFSHVKDEMKVDVSRIDQTFTSNYAKLSDNIRQYTAHGHGLASHP